MTLRIFFRQKTLFILLVLFSFNVGAYELPCNTINVDTFLGANYAKSLDISVFKVRKWNKNYFRALKARVDIEKKYKKKFKAKIKVLFNNNLECTFQAKIRISGDHIDHLDDIPGITSLDVELLNGNIDSVIKFKLFIPKTRGGDNEIISTALLKELGFLAPKTYHIPSVFNGLKTTFLFQEKITKEFIESNGLREAPILEGDERFLFGNDLVAFDRFGLARILNKKWAKKGITSLDISKTALSQLNKAYLEYISGKHIYRNRNDRFLRANALSNGNYIDKDREFRAILVAISASHALRPHNRSFYYDPMYRHLKPIFYDGYDENSNITRLNSSLSDFMYFGNTLNSDEIIGSLFALQSLGKLNRKHFHTRLEKLGLDYSLAKVSGILEQVIVNLKIIKNTPSINLSKNPYIPYFSNTENLEKDTNKKKLVFSTDKRSYVEICNLLLTSCRYEMFNIKDYSKLIQGRFSDDSGDSYIFIGNKREYLTGQNTKKEEENRKFSLEDGVQLVIYGSSEALINKEDKTIELKQNNLNDRFVLKGGTLNNWSIKLLGLMGKKANSEQRFNKNLLTGCLTLLDLSIKNVSIDIDGALCEDGVNLVRVSGTLNSVVVKNVLSDAIDVDFSNLSFKNISVKGAGNDCVDLSSGNYHIGHAELYNCEDKAISVGEKSKLTIDSAQISKTNIGIAAKDSSIIRVNSVTVKSTVACFSAYNKKQEFWGGKITVGEHNCPPSQVIQQKGSLVEFVQ
jgi:hypothetical protein